MSDILDQLHRLAFASLRKHDGLLDVVLDSYDRGLDAYAAIWTSYVDILQPGHQSDFFRRFASPNGAMRTSVGRLLKAAVETGTTEELDALAYYPLRATQWAIGQRAEAYFAFLSLYPLMYRLSGQQREPQGNFAFIRDRSWRYLSEALRLILPAMMSSGDPAVDESMVVQARASVRMNMFEVASAAATAGDFATFSKAARHLRRSATDDD